MEEIEVYCKERNNNINARQFYDYYEANNWKDRDGKQVKSWKQKVITWEGRKKQEIKPSWLNKTYEQELATPEEEEEIKKMLEEFE